MGTYRLRLIDALLAGVATVLTLTTGYIHYWVGGPLLLLNAAGYLTLAIAIVITALVFRRALPLVMIGAGAYAAVTIGGWLIMGPYFDVAYFAKGIEVGLIAIVAIWLGRNSLWARASVTWAIGVVRGVLRMGRVADPVSTGDAE